MGGLLHGGWIFEDALFSSQIESLAFQPQFEHRVIESHGPSINVYQIFLEQRFLNGIHICRRLQTIFPYHLLPAETLAHTIGNSTQEIELY